MDGRMSVVMNNFREICAVHKAGGVLLSAEQVCCIVARGRREVRLPAHVMVGHAAVADGAVRQDRCGQGD
jgi:hypothetical protein